MANINFDDLKDLIIEMYSTHQASVSKTGSKQVFAVLKKGKSTGYNEMNPSFALERIEFLERPEADRPSQTPKLDVVDFIVGMIETGDVSPLLILARFFGVACFQLPDPAKCSDDASRILTTITNAANKECTDGVRVVLEALADDNSVDRDEAAVIEKEANEAASAWMKAAAVAREIKERKQ